MRLVRIRGMIFDLEHFEGLDTANDEGHFPGLEGEDMEAPPGSVRVHLRGGRKAYLSADDGAALIAHLMALADSADLSPP